MNNLPPEIIDLIFSYMSAPTNKIMKDFINTQIKQYTTDIIINNDSGREMLFGYYLLKVHQRQKEPNNKFYKYSRVMLDIHWQVFKAVKNSKFTNITTIKWYEY
jgi:hypothetical protein